MCFSKYNTVLFPITTYMCEEASIFCDTNPNSPVKFPCCIECYCCLSPIGLVIDTICFPKNIYQYCIDKDEKKINACNI